MDPALLRAPLNRCVCFRHASNFRFAVRHCSHPLSTMELFSIFLVALRNQATLGAPRAAQMRLLIRLVSRTDSRSSQVRVCVDVHRERLDRTVLDGWLRFHHIDNFRFVIRHCYHPLSIVKYFLAERCGCV
jgi:hypothetical protein